MAGEIYGFRCFQSHSAVIAWLPCREEQFPDGRERETLRLPGTKKVPGRDGAGHLRGILFDIWKWG